MTENSRLHDGYEYYMMGRSWMPFWNLTLANPVLHAYGHLVSPMWYVTRLFGAYLTDYAGITYMYDYIGRV